MVNDEINEDPSLSLPQKVGLKTAVLRIRNRDTQNFTRAFQMVSQRRAEAERAEAERPRSSLRKTMGKIGKMGKKIGNTIGKLTKRKGRDGDDHDPLL